MDPPALIKLQQRALASRAEFEQRLREALREESFSDVAASLVSEQDCPRKRAQSVIFAIAETVTTITKASEMSRVNLSLRSAALSGIFNANPIPRADLHPDPMTETAYTI